MVTHRARRCTLPGGLLMFFLMLLPQIVVSQQPSIADRMGVRHWSGQSVSPVYEGFDRNPDGTFNLWFGYMNRNYEEELDVPVGPDNTFEPGGDRGQPTHFAPRRHKDIFKIVVPADFGKQTLVWQLTTKGKTESVAGTLNPVWLIDRRRSTRGGNDDAIDSNTPPVVSVQPLEQTIAAGARATFAVTATDDGLPRRTRTSFSSPNLPPQLYAVPNPPPRGGGPGEPGRGGAGAGGRGAAAAGVGTLSYEWFKFRGPGKVTFTEPLGLVPGGKITTAATFSEPGDYIVQVVVDDGSGESAGNFGYHCCWTNVDVKVHVMKGVATGQR